MTLLATRHLDVDGHRVRIADLGSGPPLVLTHGYPENLQIWSRIAPILAARHRVVALDWPGLGDSDPWPGGSTPRQLADRLARVLDVLRLDRATCWGLDMGGQPLVALAAHHPDRVADLVVSNSLVWHDAPTSWELRLLRRYGWNLRILTWLPGRVMARAERTFLVREPLDAELREELWGRFRRPEVRRTLVRMCAAYQATLPKLPDAAARITCPTTLLWGGADRHFPVVHAQRLAAAIPAATVRVVDGAGHWMVWEEAARVATAFLGRATPTG